MSRASGAPATARCQDGRPARETGTAGDLRPSSGQKDRSRHWPAYRNQTPAAPPFLAAGRRRLRSAAWWCPATRWTRRRRSDLAAARLASGQQGRSPEGASGFRCRARSGRGRNSVARYRGIAARAPSGRTGPTHPGRGWPRATRPRRASRRAAMRDCRRGRTAPRAAPCRGRGQAGRKQAARFPAAGAAGQQRQARGWRRPGCRGRSQATGAAATTAGRRRTDHGYAAPCALC